jgi:membrane protease YdiL (CAAX protease family)
MKLSLTLGKRLALFACITIFCLIIASVIVGFIRYKAGENSVPMMRIAAVLQDILLFIIPALVTAILITRLPATFLAVDKKPKGVAVILAIATMICSIPAMNALITFNDGIHLPQSMAALEAAMRHTEEAAQKSIATLLGGDGIGSLAVSVLIVGVLAGFSEEIFFRGTFLRLLTTGRVNTHVAIWVVAFIFSAMHMQFYGFMPRMLLGAFFGYLLCWSGSLWLPIIMHALNNSLYIIEEWSAGGNEASINTFGAENMPAVAVSIVLTIAGLYTLRKSLISKH